MSGQFTGQVTLDGPSGTGKSSVARAVAARLGASYLDTGAMYRAATVAVLDAGADPDDAAVVARVVAAARIEVGTAAGAEVVRVDGVDVARRIRSAEVTALAADLRRRDEYDSSRADSPLRPAADAVVVDSTDLVQEQTVDRVVALACSAVGVGER